MSGLDRIDSEDHGGTRVLNSLRTISAAGMEINPCPYKGTTDTDDTFFAGSLSAQGHSSLELLSNKAAKMIQWDLLAMNMPLKLTFHRPLVSK